MIRSYRSINSAKKSLMSVPVNLAGDQLPEPCKYQESQGQVPRLRLCKSKRIKSSRNCDGSSYLCVHDKGGKSVAKYYSKKSMKKLGAENGKCFP